MNASVNENRTMRFLLFLNISCPPIINRVFVSDSDTADDLRTCRKSRYVSWDFRRRDTVSKDDADYFMRNEICDSPYLRIDLDNIEVSRLFRSIVTVRKKLLEAAVIFTVIVSHLLPQMSIAFRPFSMEVFSTDSRNSRRSNRKSDLLPSKTCRSVSPDAVI